MVLVVEVSRLLSSLVCSPLSGVEFLSKSSCCAVPVPSVPVVFISHPRYRTYEVLKEETANPRVRWAYLPYSMHMAGPREVSSRVGC